LTAVGSRLMVSVTRPRRRGRGVVRAIAHRDGEFRDGPRVRAVYVAEDPKEADRIAAARRTENVCRYET